jgi:tetratricopeptide (TPR) repeat protein
MHYWRKALFLLILSGLLFYLGFGWFTNYRISRHVKAADQALTHLDFQMAQCELEASLQIRANDGSLQLKMASVARRNNQFELAEEHLKRFQQLVGESPESLLEFAMLKAQQGDLAHSQDFLLAALRNQSVESPLILEALAQGAFQVLHLGSAMKYLNQLLELQPDHHLALYWRGLLWERSLRLDEALGDYQQAIAINPNFLPARLRLAELNLGLKKGPEAQEHLKFLYEKDPKDPQILLDLAKCLVMQGETAKAQGILGELLGNQPDHPAGLVLFATLKLAAEKMLRRVWKRNPNDKEAGFQLARCLEVVGKQDEAAAIRAQIKEIEKKGKEIEKAVEKVQKSPNNPDLRRETALLCLQAGRIEEAVSWLEGALQIDPSHKPTHTTLADLYARIGRADLAAQHRKAAQSPRN